jgi:tetratricopeptide (TPR) repeat protein
MTRLALAIAVFLGSACGGAPVRPTPLRPEVIEMEELRITAATREEGDLELDSYDAETLFNRGFALVNQQRCRDAVVLYDRLANEFPSSRFRSAGLYNAGYCLQDLGDNAEAILRYERLLREGGEDRDVLHASFQLAKLYPLASRFEDEVRIADQLLQNEELTPDERMEALARRAEGLNGMDDIAEAERQARSALVFYRTRTGEGSVEEQRVRDGFFPALANYVLAETHRKRASAIAIPQATVAEQHAILETRAQHMLDAQREYFNTMQFRNAFWAAAAGYRIGAMYDEFWNAIMTAPTPPPRNPLPPGTEQVYEQEFRNELARLVKPLIRHAIRYWELTLMMVERTHVQSEWTARIREDLDRARQRLLDQPPDAPPEALENRGTAPRNP